MLTSRTGQLWSRRCSMNTRPPRTGRTSLRKIMDGPRLLQPPGQGISAAIPRWRRGLPAASIMHRRCRPGKRMDRLREDIGGAPMRDSGHLHRRIPATRETQITTTREAATPPMRNTEAATSGIRKIGLGVMQLTSRTGGRRLTNRIRAEKTIPGLRSNRTRRTPLRTSRALRRKKSIIGELWVRTLWNSEGKRPRLPFSAGASQAGAPAPHCGSIFCKPQQDVRSSKAVDCAATIGGCGSVEVLPAPASARRKIFSATIFATDRVEQPRAPERKAPKESQETYVLDQVTNSSHRRGGRASNLSLRDQLPGIFRESDAEQHRDRTANCEPGPNDVLSNAGDRDIQRWQHE
jgi:hypothetical protein